MEPIRDETELLSPIAQLQETPEDVSDWHFVKLAGSSDCGSENASLASETAEAQSHGSGSACVSAVATASEEHANAVLQEPMERSEQSVQATAETQVMEEGTAAGEVSSDGFETKELSAGELQEVVEPSKVDATGDNPTDTSYMQHLISKAGNLEAMATRMAVIICQNLHSLKTSSMEVLSSWFSVVNAWLDSVSKHHMMPKRLSEAVHQLRLQLKSAQVNWGIVSLSASLLVVSTAFLATAVHNKHLSRQLKQKDRELAKLVMKIFNLQDALQGLRQTRVIRHTSIRTFATHPVF